MKCLGSDIIKIKVKGYLKNNTENQLLDFDVYGIKSGDKIIYSDNGVKNTLNLKNNQIILKRESDDFLNTFIFDKKKSRSNYLLKEVNSDVDIEIITLDIDVNEDNVYIRYKVLDTDCDYEYKIEMREVL